MRYALIIAAFLVSHGVMAQTVLTVTNNILDTQHAPLTGVAGTFRLNISAWDGVEPVSLTGTNVLHIYDATDYGWAPFTNSRLVGTVIGETTNGKVRFVIGSLSARSYILEAVSIQPNPLLTFKIGNHSLTVTSTPAQASVINITNLNEITLGSVTVGVEIAEGAVVVGDTYVTNIITITNVTWITNSVTVGDVQNFITNNVYNSNIVEMVNNIGAVQVFYSNALSFGFAESTNAPQFIRLYGGDNLATGVVDGANLSLYLEGGGGGDVTNIIGAFPILITNFNGNVYVGFTSFEGTITFPGFTNTAIIQFGGPTSHFYTVPITETQMVAHLWGGAGYGLATAGGAGYTEILFPVTGGEVLEIQVGEGSLQVPSTNTTGVSTAPGGFPDGGLGVNRRNYAASLGSGGGSTRIWRGTNLIAVAGGSGGNSGAGGGLGGSGGGVSGGDGISTGTGAGAGLGGTQTAGGEAADTALSLIITNTAGAFFSGGSGGVSDTAATGGAGGGGGGYYGGAGGLGGNAAASRGGGGGGSGYYNTALVIFGTTLRGSGGTPSGQDLPYYGTDTGGIGWGVATGTGTRAGHGAVVLRRTNP